MKRDTLGCLPTTGSGVTLVGMTRASCLLLLVALLAGCASQAAAPAPPTAAPAAAKTIKVVHLGCSAYCQTAGGYGDGGAPPPRQMIRLDTSGPVTPLSDGTVPLTFTCLYTRECLGTAFIDSVYGHGPSFAGIDHGSDVRIPARGTLTLAVPLPGRALALLAREHRLKVALSTDLFWSFCPQQRNPLHWNCLIPRSSLPAAREFNSLELQGWIVTLSSSAHAATRSFAAAATPPPDPSPLGCGANCQTAGTSASPAPRGAASAASAPPASSG